MDEARRTASLRRTGGSLSVVLPKPWLDELGIRDRVDLVRTDAGIVVAPPQADVPSIEDEPEFARFLAFAAKDALAYPEILGGVDELVAGDDDLLAGVDPE
jgi:hypothetical protein